MRIRDRRGRTTRVTDRRLVHMAEPHLAALELVIEAEDWSGPIEVRSALDGSVQNRGVERYRRFASQHLTAITRLHVAIAMGQRQCDSGSYRFSLACSARL